LRGDNITWKGMKMKKILLVLLATLLILPALVLPIFAQESTLSAEMWLNSDASGRGMFKLFIPPGGTDTIEDFMGMVEGDPTVQVEPYRDLGNGSYEVDFSWDDFQAAFDSTVIVVGDTVEVDFGDTTSFVELIVHLPGQVLKTDGQVKGTNTVIFQQTATSQILFQSGGPLPTSTPPSPTPTEPSPTPTPTESPSDAQLKIELRLENDGSGKGTLKGFLIAGLTLEEIVSSLEETLTVVDKEQLGNRFTINIRWQDFNQAFANAIRTENADGTITIEVSDLGTNEITLILKGAIKDTTGQKQGSGTVVFSGATDGTVTYKPAGGSPSPTASSPTPTSPPTTPSIHPSGSTTPPPTPTPTPTGEASKGLFSTFGTIEIIIVAGGALLLLVIIILIVVLSSRRRRLPPPPPPVYPGTPPPTYTAPPPPSSPGTTQTAAALHFCPQCGGPLQTGQRFCESCGKPVN
jgi:hypothetical protein